MPDFEKDDFEIDGILNQYIPSWYTLDKPYQFFQQYRPERKTGEFWGYFLTPETSK